MKKFVLLKSRGFDAHYNQALEATLFDTVGDDAFVLYLWANDNAVFIGRHQNAYTECDLPRLEADGGKLARRITGGGAVYHDKGNVNYSFIAPSEFYDEQRQFGWIVDTLKELGINAEKTGRNDITVGGRKFSGNAFYKNAEAGLHHGTILIGSDYGKIGKYLTASKLKLQSKNIASVPQRIINLNEINPRIDKEQIFDALALTVRSALGASLARIEAEDLDQTVLQNRLAFFTDKTRLYGADTHYDVRLEHRFDWGTADIRLKLDKNKIIGAVIYNDCLDTDLIARKENDLLGADVNEILDVLR